MAEGSNQAQRDASDVGRPCSICSSIDFLPFKCAYCQRVFCKEHSTQVRPEGHGCPAYKSFSNIVPEEEQKRDGSATFKGLLPDRSRKAQEITLTPEELEKQKKKEAALALLRKNFPNSATGIASSSTTSKTPTQSASSRKIMIMKLKQNAKALDRLRNEKQIPLGERRYFFAIVSNGGETEKRPFWLPKNCSCGKALDLLTSALKVPNENNIATTPASERLVLVTLNATGAMTSLATGKTIESAISDGDQVMVVKTSEVGP